MVGKNPNLILHNIMILNQMNRLRFNINRSIVRNIVPLTMKYSTQPQKQSATSQTTPTRIGNLLKQPVPPLENTLKTFLDSTKPHLSDAEFQNTKRVAEDYFHNDAKVLQEKLYERDKRLENWLSDWWLNVAYLEYRSPVVVFSSPGQVFPVQKFNDDHERLSYATKSILAAVDFSLQIYNDKIPQEKMGKDLLDMSQYKKIFGTCRIPKPVRDELKLNPDSRHIVVAVNNNYYKLPVLNDRREPLSYSQIFDQLKAIQKLANEQKGPAIGVLTSQDRDKWADSYAVLESLGENSKSLKEIQTALFLLSLDDNCPNRQYDSDLNVSALNLIHGWGSRGGVNNRWYDKTIQIIITRDGLSGITYEHSPSEGGPIAILADYINDFITRDRAKQTKPVECQENFAPLKFEINERVNNDILDANRYIDKLVQRLLFTLEHFTEYGKGFIKSKKLSPDSYIQMAIQYAFYRLHRTPGAHYESAGLRKFKHGRTECIRSCSVESIAFAKAMLNDKVHDVEKVKALRKAIDSHKAYTIKALNGMGCDRHLLGLKLAAVESGMPIHQLYSDVGYVRSAHMRLSTSQVPSMSASFMAYAPLTDDGYGCCYNPREKDMFFALSAFSDNNETNLMQFREALVQSLKDMQSLLERTETSKL